MTTINKPYVGDTGTIIRLDTGADLSGATALVIEALPPGRGKTDPPDIWPASADGSFVEHVCAAGTLHTAGLWMLQAKAVFPHGSWSGATFPQRVFGAFE